MLNAPVVLSVVIALAAMLLVWSGAELGAAGLASYRRSFTERARFNLRELFLFMDPARLYALNVGVMLLVGAIVWLLTKSSLLGVGFALLAGFLPWWAFRWMRARRLLKIEDQLPDALLILAGGLKAGVSLTSAVSQLVREARPPITQEFDLMLREQRLGVALDEALENLNRRVPTQSVTLVVSAMRIASTTGGGLAETLERASQTVRSKLAMEGKIRALTAQGKLQAWIVGALPLVLMYVLARMEPEAMSLLWTTRLGYAFLIVIALLLFFGVLLIRKIVDIDV
ncbi:MAG TPA: type II secretion system F family protein [Burkholderiaceae bacterium]|nr:type II secretion system F family protein [Burkholderiaceae bacterium]